MTTAAAVVLPRPGRHCQQQRCGHCGRFASGSAVCGLCDGGRSSVTQSPSDSEGRSPDWVKNPPSASAGSPTSPLDTLHWPDDLKANKEKTNFFYTYFLLIVFNITGTDLLDSAAPLGPKRSKTKTKPWLNELIWAFRHNESFKIKNKRIIFKFLWYMCKLPRKSTKGLLKLPKLILYLILCLIILAKLSSFLSNSLNSLKSQWLQQHCNFSEALW